MTLLIDKSGTFQIMKKKAWQLSLYSMALFETVIPFHPQDNSIGFTQTKTQ